MAADSLDVPTRSKPQEVSRWSVQQKVSNRWFLTLRIPNVLTPSVLCLQDSSSSVGSGEFTGIKELDDISQEISQLQR